MDVVFLPFAVHENKLLGKFECVNEKAVSLRIKTYETRKNCCTDRDWVDDNHSKQPIAAEFAPTPKSERMAGNIQCEQCSN